jgi:hypothetical protein
MKSNILVARQGIFGYDIIGDSHSGSCTTNRHRYVTGSSVAGAVTKT